MTEIHYIDRATQLEKKEKVYGQFFLNLLYGQSIFSKFFSHLLLPLFSKIPLFSQLYGAIQASRFSKRKIAPFIKNFHIDTSEFLVPAHSFQSFNDFFTRKLKPSSRPIAEGNDVAVLPADGRYLFFQNIETTDGFLVKGKKFSLEQLLGDRSLAKKYQSGAMAIARLCPTDYHRFHFPCACVPSKPHLINGPLYSVNPIALKQNIAFLTENKRVISCLESKYFGDILFIEVGATHVGSIHQTYIPGDFYSKGDEKGFFSFGGSCILLLFEPFKIAFDKDLLEASQRKIETYALFGQSMGRSIGRSIGKSLIL